MNTGWTGGKYGVGSRMSLKDTRQILENIHNGSLEKEEYEMVPGFNLSIPKNCTGIKDQSILNPINTWTDKDLFKNTSKKLASQFINNFKKYESGTPKEVVENGGPNMSGF